MGNSKSKKLKISDAPSEDTRNNEERINKLKSDIPEAAPKSINDGNGDDAEQNKEKEHDNASSASTVEALDDK